MDRFLKDIRDRIKQRELEEKMNRPHCPKARARHNLAIDMLLVFSVVFIITFIVALIAHSPHALGVAVFMGGFFVLINLVLNTL